MASIIGALRVTLGMDTAAFESGAAKAQAKATGLKGALSSFAGAFTPISIGATAAAAGLAVFTIGMRKAAEAAQWADDLAATADHIGIAASALQELRHAAETVDVPAETLDEKLRALNSTLGALKSGVGDGKIRKAFEELGIPQSALASMNDATDLLPVLADHIKQAGSFAEQVQIAKKLQIEELLPLLQLGADGIGDVRQAAEDLGLVMADGVVAHLADMNEQMRVADQRTKIAAMSLGSVMTPALLHMKEQVADLFSWMGRLLDRFNSIKNQSTATLESRRAGILDQIAHIQVEQIRHGDKVGGDETIAKLRTTLGLLNEQIALNKEVAATSPSASAGGNGGGGGGGGHSTRSAKSSRSALAGLSDGSLESDAAKGGQDWSIIAKDTSEFTRAMEEAARAGLGNGAIKALNDNQDEIRESYRNAIGGGLDAAIYGGGKGLMEYLADSFKRRLIDNLADGLANVFSQLGGGGGGKSGGIVGTALAIGRKIFGFASGGSGVVGGSGGVDSQLVSMKLTPGELVDVRRPGQDQGGTASVHLVVEASPYFDARVAQVAGPMSVRAAVGGASLAEGRAVRRQSRRLA